LSCETSGESIGPRNQTKGFSSVSAQRQLNWRTSPKGEPKMNMPGFTAESSIAVRKPFASSYSRRQRVQLRRGVSPAMIDRGGTECTANCWGDPDCMYECGVNAGLGGDGGGGGGGGGGLPKPTCNPGCGPCQMVGSKYERVCLAANCKTTVLSCGRAPVHPVTGLGNTGSMRA
jgi:hypothetical protein